MTDTLDVQCPICDAFPGDECLSLLFRAPRETPHISRREKAKRLTRQRAKEQDSDE